MKTAIKTLMLLSLPLLSFAVLAKDPSKTLPPKALPKKAPLLATTTQTPPFSFSLNGKLQKTLSVKEMTEKVGLKEITAIEPHDGQTVTYVGFSFPALLEAVYGKDWMKIKKYTFKCKDGYNPLVSPEKFLKYDSYLVYAKKDSKDFNLKKNNEGGKMVDMSPYYITWDTNKAPELKTIVYDRPYQLVSIDVIL